MSNSRLDGVRKGTRIPDLLLRRQSLYPTELYGPIVLKPAISRGLTPYIVFLGLDNILSEEGIIHGLLLSIYCRVRSHFSRRIELTTELLFFSRLVLALFLRRQSLYPTELYGPIVLKPAISRGLTPYIVFLGLDNILSEEGIIHGLLLSIYCRVRSHFSRRIELTTELLFFSRLVLALFLRRRTLYPAELQRHL